VTDLTALTNLVLIIAAAIAGGLLALLLKQPLIVGYLIGGLVLGPYTPGLRIDFNEFSLFTDIGLALLLFVLGANMSISKFRGLGSVILLGGFIQIALTIGLGLLFVQMFGCGIIQGFLIGLILAQSSSAVMAKVLDDRDETDSRYGRIAVGVSAVQDLTSLPLLLILLILMGDESTASFSLLETFGFLVLIVVLVYIFAKYIWPKLVVWLDRFGSGEMTLLIALGLALGGGILLQMIGLSIALGAFLAGLIVAEAPRRPVAISRVLPLRDIFAAVFFVSIGALFDPSVVLQSYPLLLGFLAILIVGKAIIGAVVTRMFGHRRSTSIMTGLLLAQIGEFAFIVGMIGLNRGAISNELFSVVMAASVISIFVNSLMLDSAPPVMEWIARAAHFNVLLKKPSASIWSVFRKRRKPKIVPPTPPKQHKTE
jgi:monovalent cation:H+ antiporter-2, CPA2 family